MPVLNIKMDKLPFCAGVAFVFCATCHAIPIVWSIVDGNSLPWDWGWYLQIALWILFALLVFLGARTKKRGFSIAFVLVFAFLYLFLFLSYLYMRDILGVIFAGALCAGPCLLAVFCFSGGTRRGVLRVLPAIVFCIGSAYVSVTDASACLDYYGYLDTAYQWVQFLTIACAPIANAAGFFALSVWLLREPDDENVGYVEAELQDIPSKDDGQMGLRSVDKIEGLKRMFKMVSAAGRTIPLHFLAGACYAVVALLTAAWVVSSVLGGIGLFYHLGVILEIAVAAAFAGLLLAEAKRGLLLIPVVANALYLLVMCFGCSDMFDILSCALPAVALLALIPLCLLSRSRELVFVLPSVIYLVGSLICLWEVLANGYIGDVFDLLNTVRVVAILILETVGFVLLARILSTAPVFVPPSVVKASGEVAGRQHSVPAANMVEVAGEIRGFKELLDMGAITQEEYDMKKKELLGL